MNLNQQPDVSLVVLAHNRASLVVHTVQATLDQTVPFADIIVVDDASTDDTSQGKLLADAEAFA